MATVARDSVPITPNADTARVEPITSCGYEQTLLRGATRQQRSQGLSSHPGNTFVLENLDLSFAKASTDAKISPRFPSPFVGMTAPCSRCPFLLIPSLGRTRSGKRSRRIALPRRNSLLLPVTTVRLDEKVNRWRTVCTPMSPEKMKKKARKTRLSGLSNSGPPQKT